MLVVNRTPYTCERVVIFDRRGAETLLVAIKARFQFSKDAVRLGDEQPPITMADEYTGEPGISSIRRASELLPPKRATDILLTGHAVAPKAGVSALEIGLRVGAITHRAVVFGERRGFREIRQPKPFEKIALTWENAFGGADKSPDDERNHAHRSDNPVGRGFFAKASKVNADEVLLPNVEHATERLQAPGDAPTPAGFAPVAPSWQPRAAFAGTYDERWVRDKAPLLPDDFDERFLQAAPPPLVASEYLQGNEPCMLVGFVPEGRVGFSLQTMPPFVRTRFARKVALATPRLETIHFDTDERTVDLLWKGAVDVHGRVEELREIEVRFDP